MGGVCGGESGRRRWRGDGADTCTRDSMGDAIATNNADAGRGEDTGAFFYMLLAADAAAAAETEAFLDFAIFKKHTDQPNTIVSTTRKRF